MRLQITIPIAESEEIVNAVREALQSVNFGHFTGADIEVSLTREGDRSGANLLLPKLQGRMGEHYQNKKAKLKEIVDG